MNIGYARVSTLDQNSAAHLPGIRFSGFLNVICTTAAARVKRDTRVTEPLRR